MTIFFSRISPYQQALIEYTKEHVDVFPTTIVEQIEMYWQGRTAYKIYDGENWYVVAANNDSAIIQFHYEKEPIELAIDWDNHEVKVSKPKYTLEHSPETFMAMVVL